MKQNTACTFHSGAMLFYILQKTTLFQVLQSPESVNIAADWKDLIRRRNENSSYRNSVQTGTVAHPASCPTSMVTEASLPGDKAAEA
jgi:hypothetical protein